MGRLRTAVLFPLALACGCHLFHVAPPPTTDPDEKSGPDSARSGAMEIALGRAVTDDVSFEKQDMTDWKSLALTAAPGLLTVALRWESPTADLRIDLLDEAGNTIVTSPGTTAGTQQKRITAQVTKPATYYFHITAPRAREGSVYTLETEWEPSEPDSSGAPPKPQLPQTERATGAARRFNPEEGLQGRIVSSYREGGQLVLHIDKGTSAGVRVGQTGSVLEGPAGATSVPGGVFRITHVIDESRCIARTTLYSVGRNNRVSISVGGEGIPAR